MGALNNLIWWNQQNMKPVIVADIGGTNARFGLVAGLHPGSGKPCVEHKQQYMCADFPDFNHVFEQYLGSIADDCPDQACIAVAGPVKDQQVRMTNLDWNISATEILKSFRLSRFEIINDYTAQIHATLVLGPEDLSTICRGETDPLSPKCIVGPGTGLGVAAIAPVNGRWATLSGEGGHVTLASTGQYESRLIRQIAPAEGMISAEMALSGPGIRRLYQAVCAIEGYPVLANTPAGITAAALAGSDPAATKSISMFCRLLGGLAGDMILVFGARGGAYLTGGILPRIEPMLKQGGFEHCLKNKGVMSHYLDDINVALITTGDAALIGAAAWFYGETQ